ncbi:hypothetical protein PoB_005490500 [Plakobranchus ocellatus]|uniref:Uncharacterized protein n=1 Tax=Plakobranchus ocellatus TaxID=259542 RepID=A0AAV4C9N8_9GAST|nr:hypothetical protein PoB_005490500 [Plakobranchus ocellatus]
METMLSLLIKLIAVFNQYVSRQKLKGVVHDFTFCGIPDASQDDAANPDRKMDIYSSSTLKWLCRKESCFNAKRHSPNPKDGFDAVIFSLIQTCINIFDT